ncbi:hypothetical protein OG209_05405 [Streptomyces sp. NBC_01383]|uniref:hypothetical protein n=1 Tax=Streptomyces sp. NBC_01383 TaxID=2903846 RepID=UPI00324972E9
MTDNCPNCPQKDVEPITQLRAGVEASDLYRCTGCGHIWSTNRDLRSYGQEAA